MKAGDSNIRRASGLREGFLAGVTENDLQEIAEALVRRAKQGDVAAARLLLDRLVGPNDLQRWPDEAQVQSIEWIASLGPRCIGGATGI